MASVNKATLIGNLGQDPELKYMPSGDAVCNFTIATKESWKDRDGNQQEKTEWHNIVAFKRLAEICGEYLRKGKQVYIEGRLRTSSWEDQNGVKKYKTEIIANDMQMLGRRDDDMGGGGGGYDQQSRQEPQQSSQQSGQQSEPQGRQQNSQPPSGNNDDDLPF